MLNVKGFIRAALAADSAKGKGFRLMVEHYRAYAPTEDEGKKAREAAHDAIIAETGTERLKDSVAGASAQVYSSLILGFLKRTGGWPEADATLASVKAPRKARTAKPEGEGKEGEGNTADKVQTVADTFGLAFSAAISEVLNRAAAYRKAGDQAGLNGLADRLSKVAREA